ncbi:altronate dehydratase (plasmid) [Halostagnicola larsenii XH-48]|uniref:Altronate dehydratase n=1 Tax=Halostagnicola larsenii XH-48 TaxID=797299 RepID=W0JSP1_9EURY|nr:altronate dehydratase [Halostagnicola larsenii XH-48]
MICSHTVAERIGAAVDGAWSAPHDHGCGQIGADRDQTQRTFVGVGANPNVTGTVVVGLGCETIQSDDVAAELRARGVPVRRTTIQEAGGTEACFEEGVSAAEELRSGAVADERADMALEDLTVGIVASDLRPSSLERADPLVGAVVEELVETGVSVVVGATDRVLPHENAVRADLATDDAREGMAALVERARSEPPRVTSARSRATETEYEQVAALWGRLPVRDVLRYADPATHEGGVALMDAPSSFAEAATGLVAAGAQVLIHVTADGIPTGHPVAPVLKVTGDDDTYSALAQDIDIHAGRTSPAELLEELVAVLNGAPTCAETHGVTTFGITRAGPSM